MCINFIDSIYNSVILEAPSNAFSSMPVIWFRLRSNFTKLGNRPNNPSERIRPNSLSCNNLKIKQFLDYNFFIVILIELIYNSVVYSGISLGISFNPRPEQSTIVPSQVQPLGQALSIRHSPAYLVRNSSWPKE